MSLIPKTGSPEAVARLRLPHTSVQISRTTLFRKRFTAQQWPEVPDRESKALVAAEENLL